MPRHLHGRRLPPAALHDTPLDAEELTALDSFLREGRGGDLWSLLELDGYITAVVVLPAPQMPVMSYAAIFGDDGDEGAVTRLMAAEARGILPLLLRHWRTVEQRPLATERWALPCASYDATLRAYDWAFGFVLGIRKHEREWARHMTGSRYQQLLMPALEVFERMYRELVGRASPRERRLPPVTLQEHIAFRRDLVLAAGDFYLECRRGKRTA